MGHQSERERDNLRKPFENLTRSLSVGWGLEGSLSLSLIGGHQEIVKHLRSVGEMSMQFYYIV